MVAQLEMFEPEVYEPKHKYILIQKMAIQVTGDWRPIVDREVRTLCPWGIKQVIPGLYNYVYSTPSKILHEGYTLLKDTSQKKLLGTECEVAQFSVNDFRMKQIKAPESNKIVAEFL